MEKDNIFQQMATYDFKSPVTVQTIIEDSDEDIYSVIELSPESNSNYDEVETSKQRETNSSHTSEIQSAISKLYSSECQDINGFSNYCQTKLDKNDYEKTHEKSAKTRRRKSTEKETTNKQKCDSKRKKNINNSNITKTDLNVIQSSCNSPVSNSVSNEDTFSSDHTLPKTNPLKISIQINEVKKVSSYISDLLTTVSKQLITVIEAYNIYIRVTSVANCDPARKQDSLNSYLSIRDQCYNLSYNTVLNILLPEENNKIFFNSFIESTVQIANCSNNAVQLSHEQVQIFYLELLEWTKKKKKSSDWPSYQDINNSNSKSDNRYNQLRQQLSEPAKHLSKNVYSRDTQQRVHSEVVTSNTCLFSVGPPGKEVSINIQSDILNNQQGQTIMNENSMVLNKNNNSRRQYESKTNNIALLNESIIVSAERNSEIQYMSLPQANYHTNSLALLSTDISVTGFSKHQNIQQPTSSFNSQYSQFLQSNSNNISQNNNSNPVIVTPAALSKCQYQQPLPPPPPYEENCNWQKDWMLSCNNPTYSHQIQNKQPEPPTHIETMRSVSTDSGFISPLNFNTDSDQPTNTAWPENGTPQITHVTSLNPKASFLSQGLCHVCGKVTKKKCLGCLQYYYCDFLCQRTDWNNHMNVCSSVKR